jgi:hypothetical protein
MTTRLCKNCHRSTTSSQLYQHCRPLKLLTVSSKRCQPNCVNGHYQPKLYRDCEWTVCSLGEAPAAVTSFSRQCWTVQHIRPYTWNINSLSPPFPLSWEATCFLVSINWIMDHVWSLHDWHPPGLSGTLSTYWYPRYTLKSAQYLTVQIQEIVHVAWDLVFLLYTQVALPDYCLRLGQSG